MRNHLPRDPALQWSATRLILASMHLQYYTLNDSAGGADIDEDEWRSIHDKELLTPHECDLIKTHGGSKPYLPLLWAQREVIMTTLQTRTPAQLRPQRPALSHSPRCPLLNETRSFPLAVSLLQVAAAIDASNQLPKTDAHLMHAFRELAFTFRGHCGQITNELAEPVPFPYFHSASS